MINLNYHIKNSNLSLQKIAEKSGIGIDRLQAFIENKLQPTMSDVRKLSKSLKVSIDYLTADNSKFEEVNLLFRKAFKGEQQQYKADKFSHIIGNTFSLLTNYEKSQDLFRNFQKLDENNYVNAFRLSQKFRQIFFKGDFVSPLLSLPKILSDKLNCIIYITDLGQEIEGASAIINSVPFVFISPRFEPRMLFTLAHELGHILAHHDKSEDFAMVDNEFTYFKNSQINEESFANSFASCLLLPEEGVGLTLKKIREYFKNNNEQKFIGDIEILYLSRIYGVSFEVAAKRCEDLKLIPTGGAASLYEKLVQEHGNPEKRARALGLPDRPKVDFSKVSTNLIYSAIEKINSGEMSIGKASEILSIPITDIVSHNTEFDR